ncbi:MAG: hypothetical protein ACKVOS_11435 [Sphingorhabdus sp.]|uniref:hypothetical protein n=1 Tax=Sphingorhabdus sp. TaxID=1902408 RepID=UPI0038FD0E27
MTQDPNFYIIIGAFALTCVAVVSTLSLRGWRDWIALKHAELEMARQRGDAPLPSATSRIEVADLKERVKKLEAIAAGIDI